MKVTTKMYLLLGLSLLVGMAATLYLVRTVNRVNSAYSSLLATTVHQSEDARVMQVTFKKQVQAWKDTLLRGSNPSDMDQYSSEFLKQEESVRQMGESLTKEVKDPQALPKVERFLDEHHQLGLQYRQGLEVFRQSNGAKTFEVDKMLRGKDRPPTDLVDDIVAGLDKTRADQQAAEEASLARQQKILATILATLFSALLALSWILGRSIGRRFQRDQALLRDLSEGQGDLTARLPVHSHDEFANMSAAINLFLEKLQRMMLQVRSDVDALAHASQEFSATSQQITANSEETSTQANVVSAATEEVSRNLQTVATSTEKVSANISEIAKHASDAAKVADEALEAAKHTNATVAKLGESSSEIGQVVKVITAIAQQTNLLALNATIEAARAGEAGKGFAVVANEVKELAKQTAKATEEVGHKIAAIQTETKGAVEAITAITGIIGRVDQISVSIAQAVEEQSTTANEMARHITEAAKGSGEVARNITGVAQAAQSTSSGATDSQKAAQQLMQMSAELRGLVGQFKIDSNGNGNQALPASAR